jgi:uncharacterized protein YdaT
MAIIINIAKAKDITKDRLRAERKPLLEAKDVAFQRALESNADTSAIVAEKQRLRDITNQVDSMTTVEELKTAIGHLQLDLRENWGWNYKDRLEERL